MRKLHRKIKIKPSPDDVYKEVQYMKKRVLGLIMAFVLLLSLCPAGALRVQASETFDLAVTINTLDVDQKETTSRGGAVGLSKSTVSLGDTVTVTATPYEGYELFVIAYGEGIIYHRDGNPDLNTNTFTVSQTSSGNKIDYVTVVFIETGEITYVTLTLDLPALGAVSEAPEGGAAANVVLRYDNEVTVTRANWYTEGGIAPKTFEEGRNYFAEIELTAADKYFFTDDTTVTLNDMEVVDTEVYQDGAVLLVDTECITASEHYLWLGETQVTTANKDDILGDGLAQFLPDSETLVLDGPAITGQHERYYQIYASGTDLTIKGNAVLDNHYGGICVLDGCLTIDADINASGPFEAVFATNEVHIKGGTISTNSGAAGIASSETVIISGGNINAAADFYGIDAPRVEVTGGTLNAVATGGCGIDLEGDGLYISGGNVSIYGRECGICLDDAVLQIDNTVVSVIIDSGDRAIKPSEESALILGSSLQITEPVNAVVTGNDILNGTEYTKRIVIKGAGASAGGKWKKNAAGWWYQRPDGTYPKNQWEKIDGKWYHFDEKGYMQTGWLKLSGKWYYMNSSGAMQTGWQKISNKWYYFNDSGVMQTGWQKISNKWYYFNDSGMMQTGWKTISNMPTARSSTWSSLTPPPTTAWTTSAPCARRPCSRPPR